MIVASKVLTLSKDVHEDFDILICATGYERRSASLVEHHCVGAEAIYSILFSRGRTLSFPHNFQVMRDSNASFVEDFHWFFRNGFKDFVSLFYRKAGRPLRIAVDISSMNRTMIATTLAAITATREFVSQLMIFYVLAQFREPEYEFPEVEQIGAVIPELSGFHSDPTLPVGLMLGLGYEYGVALGMINQIDPRFTVCFKGGGHDTRYERALREANLDFDFSNYAVEISDYNVLDARTSFQHVENIAYGLLNNFRVIIVPLGPKIFAAICMLVGLRHFGRVAVWRVAARSAGPTEAFPSGEYVRAEVDLHGLLEAENLCVLKEMIFQRRSQSAMRANDSSSG